MCKCIEFSHYKFGRMEVILQEGNILFSNNFLKKCLEVRNTKLPYCSDTCTKNKNEAWVYLFEVFEYIRYARVDEDTRYMFEEWLEDIIEDCSKLL